MTQSRSTPTKPATPETPNIPSADKWQASLFEAMAVLRNQTSPRFDVLLKRGTMSVEVYAPQKQDHQTPHRQDELYIIQSGAGIFSRDGQRSPCRAGDVLLVPAGMDHRFEDFTDDFVTWVIFWGPDGGEAA
ncbi:cupin domain-containing protein [Thalassospira marina]|nr:cupin domain-containing protein [Thalassospira marina]